MFEISRYLEENPVALPKGRIIGTKDIIFLKFVESIERKLRSKEVCRSFKKLDQDYKNGLTELVNEGVISQEIYKDLVEISAELRSVFSYVRSSGKKRYEKHFVGESFVRGKVPEKALKGATETLKFLKDNKLKTARHRLSADFSLLRWAYKSYWPLARLVAGKKVLPKLHAEVRYANYDINKVQSSERFRNHKYGNMHHDYWPLSLNLIVYLTDVTSDDAPFTVLNGSDKYYECYTLRAMKKKLFTSGISNDLQSRNTDFDSIPATLASAENYGNSHDEGHFAALSPKQILGSRGDFIMFDGHQTIHQGGIIHKPSGERGALFLNFSYVPDKFLTT
jgi:hypothetical protein